MSNNINQERKLRELKDDLHDAVFLAAKYKREMGLTDLEELARLEAKATGIVYNPKKWDFTDKNGEQ